MNAMPSLDETSAYAVLRSRDAHYDGKLYYAVTTTGVYCRPSCPARRPKPENVRFFDSPEEARAEGFRACLRCQPDEAGTTPAWLADSMARLRRSETSIPLADLAEPSGLGPDQFRRRFRAATGLTPAAFFRAARAERLAKQLAEPKRITDAVFDSGFSTSSQFYREANRRLGMAPSAWRNGGLGAEIAWTVADTRLGRLLVATTERGICRIAFDEAEADLATRFPKAALRPGGMELDSLVQSVVRGIEGSPPSRRLPLDVRGTAFQEKVWHALSRIPPGQTRSYAAIAAEIGRPRAVRAVGAACGANPTAVAIPCHRAVRSDGGLGGYAWGLKRKRALLNAERDALKNV